MPVGPLPPAARIERRAGIGPFGVPEGEATEAAAISAPAAPAGPSLWGDDAPGHDHGAADDDAIDATTLFHRGRVALEAGQPAEAGTALILALRASPGLAPAVLDLLAGRSEPILTLVRGDAQRIVGREVEAMRDHAAAAGGVAHGEAAGVDDDAVGLDGAEPASPQPEPIESIAPAQEEP
jgi:hypothetical protein